MANRRVKVPGLSRSGNLQWGFIGFLVLVLLLWAWNSSRFHQSHIQQQGKSRAGQAFMTLLHGGTWSLSTAAADAANAAKLGIGMPEAAALNPSVLSKVLESSAKMVDEDSPNPSVQLPSPDSSQVPAGTVDQLSSSGVQPTKQQRTQSIHPTSPIRLATKSTPVIQDQHHTGLDLSRRSLVPLAGMQLAPSPSIRAAPEKKKDETCFQYSNMELGGEAVLMGDKNKVSSAAECCNACSRYVPEQVGVRRCNVWVWCGDSQLCPDDFYQECWLKYLPNTDSVYPTSEGPHVGWTSGSISDLDLRPALGNALKQNVGDAFMEARSKALQRLVTRNSAARPFHTITSMQGSGTAWSMRIHYYHFKKMQALCMQQAGHACEMGGFTRLLHGGENDNLMDEIPTVVVDPLPESVIPHEDYVVLNRPWAFQQFTEQKTVPEQYIFMMEPDHVILHPIPNLMAGDIPAAYPFSYIDHFASSKLTMKYAGITNEEEVQNVAPIGSSPVFLTWEQMKKVMPLWTNISILVHQDKEANKGWGWVQEMYAFAIACYVAGLHDIDLVSYLMAQPPWDAGLLDFYSQPWFIVHYTYGLDYNYSGAMLPDKVGEWHFDKRDYEQAIPRNLAEPPPKAVCNVVRALIRAFNEATSAIPCWVEYGKASADDPIPTDCNEASFPDLGVALK